MKNQSGFTLTEVMIAIALSAVIAMVAVPAYQQQAQEELEEKAVNNAVKLAQGYGAFRSAYRRNPSSVSELVESREGRGISSVTPWGGAISGAEVASGDDGYIFTLPAKDINQAYRLAAELQQYGAVANGSLVTFSAPISTIEVIESQMLCRRDIGVADCNVLEVALDAGDQDILNVGEVQGNVGRLNTVYASDTHIDTLVTEDAVVLGENSISHSGNSLVFNAEQTTFNGNITIQGDLTGNNSNISGVNKLTAKRVSSETAEFNTGTISTLTGNSLDYETGKFNAVESYKTTSEIGEFGDIQSETVNATNFITDTFNGQSGTVESLSATRANGDRLTLTDLLQTNQLQSAYTNMGVGIGSTLSLTGNATVGSVVANSGQFNGLTVTGNVSGGNFSGSNFVTSKSSVNNNKSLIDSHAKSISSNTASNNTNKNNIASLTTKVNAQAKTISDNTNRSVSNRTLAQNNASKISANAKAINSLESRAGKIESGVASLKSQLQTCQSQGGCSW